MTNVISNTYKPMAVTPSYQKAPVYAPAQSVSQKLNSAAQGVVNKASSYVAPKTSSTIYGSTAPAKTAAIQIVAKAPAITPDTPIKTSSDDSPNNSNASQISAVQAQLASLQSQLAQQRANDVQQQQHYSKNQTQQTPDQGIYSQLIAQLQAKSKEVPQAYSQQMGLVNQYNQALQDSMFNQANTETGIEKKPIPLEFQQGMKQVVQGQYTKQQAALGSGYAGASNALGSANTLGQQQLSALASATGAASPGSSQTVLSPNQTIYSSLGGNNIPAAVAGIGTPQGQAQTQNTIQSLAQQVLSNKMDYQTAFNQANQYGYDAGQQFNQALGSGFSIPASSGVQGAIGSGYSAGTQMIQKATMAENNLNQVLPLLEKYNLNSSGANILNAINQLYQKNTSNPDYMTLQSALNQISEALGQDIGQLASSKGTSIADTIKNQIALMKGQAQGQMSGGQTNTGGGTGWESI